MKKIILVEDESALQKSLGDTLRKNNFEVKSALDGELGLRLAQTENPDLILLDLILPKMDGFEVLKNLKNDAKTKNIPVIVLTNLERMQDVDKIIEMGAKTYLIKANYTLQEIVDKVKQVMA